MKQHSQLQAVVCLLALVAAALPEASMAQGTPASAPTVAPRTCPFVLPALTYAFNALEPSIDNATMYYHHDFHHQAAVTALCNTTLANATLPVKLTDLLGNVGANKLSNTTETSVRNNAGSHWNHCLFWRVLGPRNATANTTAVTAASTTGEYQGLSSNLSNAITTRWGSLDSFKAAYNASALGVFGSGWTWLCQTPGTANLSIVATPNQDNPLMSLSGPSKCTPILGIDVWEHAYYLKNQNRRADYVRVFWNVVNWVRVSSYYEAVLTGAYPDTGC